jgi:hypothetical protein
MLPGQVGCLHIELVPTCLEQLTLGAGEDGRIVMRMTTLS